MDIGLQHCKILGFQLVQFCWSSFVHKAKDWKIEPNETEVSYDVVNLYPSVPLDRSI